MKLGFAERAATVVHKKKVGSYDAVTLELTF